MIALVTLSVVCAVVVFWPDRVRLAAPFSSVGRLRSWGGRLWTSVERLAVDRPRRLLALTAGTAGVGGWLVAGAVAGPVAGIYGALAGRAVIRRTTSRRSATARARHLDDLSSLAADLRAGLPPAAIPMLTASSERASIFRLAERTGAPAADLIERVEADARAADRGRARAAAQAAGARATATLLAALPAAGIAIGFSIGADPVAVLLHTPLGAACALGAVVLQAAGLLWTDRLIGGANR